MQITLKSWMRYTDRLSRLSNKAADDIKRYVRDHGGYSSPDFDMDNFIEYSYAVARKYSNGSAALSAQMYDAIADLSGKFVPPAEMADIPTYGEVAKTVQGVIKTSQNEEEMAGAVARLVKRTGVRTTTQNARRDGAQFAWVPMGDTCAFCIALASRGWQNARSADHEEHIHSNCDCTYAIRFNNKTNVQGYDPDKYYEQYANADGGTPNEKINSMRRKYYAQNRDEILAQKASATEKREELNSSAAEETKVN